jgi:hypothetical protein
MVKIRTKYIILFWILLLILFTFYCIFRIKYISDKTQEKYVNLSLNASASSASGNVIDWVNNIKKTGIITDIPGCETVYDDNIAVGNLGYDDCKSAYNDYLDKGFDANNKFGQSKSLADMCPVSTKSPLYASCLTQLSYKFTNTANIIDNVNSDVTNLLNTRLSDRNKVLNSIDIDMNPFINNDNQNKFTIFMNNNNSVAQTPDDVFNLVGNYYGNRFATGYNVGYQNSVEGFIDDINDSNSNINISSNTTIIDKNTVDLFFGYYKPLAGQFLILDNINITLAYDTNNSVLQKNDIILSITNTDGFHLTSKVDNISKFKNSENTVILKISDIKIVNKSDHSNTIQQLLSILGVNKLSYLIITYEEYTSTENVLHKTYKIVNSNLDTILLLNKI